MKSVIKFFLKPLIRFIRYVSYNSIPALHRATLIDFVRDQAIADSATYIQEHIESVMLFDSCESFRFFDHEFLPRRPIPVMHSERNASNKRDGAGTCKSIQENALK